MVVGLLCVGNVCYNSFMDMSKKQIVLFILIFIFFSFFVYSYIQYENKKVAYNEASEAFFGEHANVSQSEIERYNSIESEISGFRETIVDAERSVVDLNEAGGIEDLFIIGDSREDKQAEIQDVFEAPRYTDNYGSGGGSTESDEGIVYQKYSVDYIDTLKKVQNEMVESGFLKESEHYQFYSLWSVNSFVNLWIDYLYENGEFSLEDVNSAKYGVNVVLPQIQSGGGNIFGSSGKIKSDFLNELVGADFGGFFGLIMEVVIDDLSSALSSFFVKDVYAAGACFKSPLCFRPGAGGSLPGSVYFTPSCYCTGVLYGRGCLDSCGGGVLPALYNPALRLCGCAGF